MSQPPAPGPRTPRDQRKVAGATMAAAVAFFLAWWVLGDEWPSLTSFEGWGPFLIATFLGGTVLVVGLALAEPKGPRDSHLDEDRGTVRTTWLSSPRPSLPGQLTARPRRPSTTTGSPSRC